MSHAPELQDRITYLETKATYYIRHMGELLQGRDGGAPPDAVGKHVALTERELTKLAQKLEDLGATRMLEEIRAAVAGARP